MAEPADRHSVQLDDLLDRRTALLTRRTALRLLGGAGFGALVVACGGGGSTSRTSSGSGSTARSTSTTSGSSAGAASGDTCVLTPELTEGPYYLDVDLVRSDITEGRPGAPLALALTVTDVATCTPIRDAVVDIWHTDASGEYSGVEGNGGTFLRGSQVTDADGVATFATIYPGWYRGRAVHIHTKVWIGNEHVSGNEVHTGQLFFPDAFSSGVYEHSPYSARGDADVKNAQDSIYNQGGSQSLLAPTASGDGYTAAITLGVHRS